MRPITVTVGPLAAASANNIALSQTPTAGALTLNGALVTGGVAVMDTPREVRITTTADETSRTFLISGTDWAGSLISETVTGVNNTTADSVLSYKTVTSITISGNATGALTVGTNGVAQSPWIRLDSWASRSTALTCVVSGTVNYTVQTSSDDPNGPTSIVAPASMTWFSAPDTALQAATTSTQSSLDFVPLWVRVLLNSGTGTVTLTATQAGSVSY